MSMTTLEAIAIEICMRKKWKFVTNMEWQFNKQDFYHEKNIGVIHFDW